MARHIAMDRPSFALCLATFNTAEPVRPFPRYQVVRHVCSRRARKPRSSHHSGLAPRECTVHHRFKQRTDKQYGNFFATLLQLANVFDMRAIVIRVHNSVFIILVACNRVFGVAVALGNVALGAEYPSASHSPVCC